MGGGAGGGRGARAHTAHRCGAPATPDRARIDERQINNASRPPRSTVRVPLPERWREIKFKNRTAPFNFYFITHPQHNKSLVPINVGARGGVGVYRVAATSPTFSVLCAQRSSLRATAPRARRSSAASRRGAARTSRSAGTRWRCALGPSARGRGGARAGRCS